MLINEKNINKKHPNIIKLDQYITYSASPAVHHLRCISYGASLAMHQLHASLEVHHLQCVTRAKIRKFEPAALSLESKISLDMARSVTEFEKCLYSNRKTKKSFGWYFIKLIKKSRLKRQMRVGRKYMLSHQTKEKERGEFLLS